MKRAVLCVIGITVGALAVNPSSAAVLCKKKKSGVVVAREACNKGESALDLAQFGAVGPQGPAGPPGSGGDSATDHASGARLRTRYHAGTDGSREFLGFFDNQRNENCYFQKANDGVMRCLPSTKAVYFSYNGGYYADAACSQRILPVQASECSPIYGVLLSESPCDRRYALHHIGDFVPSGDIYYLHPTTGLCTSFTPPASFTSYHALGEEIPPVDFVEASEVVE